MARKQTPEPSSQKVAKRVKDEGDFSQAEKFAQAAREHGTDQDEEAFKNVLRKLGKFRS